MGTSLSKRMDQICEKSEAFFLFCRSQWCHRLKLTPDWSIAAVPCYSLEWKIAFGVNDEANKIRVCSKIISSNNFFLKYVINNDILQLCLQKISLYYIKNDRNMTNLSVLHRHPMTSFTPVTQSMCGKFNNCDRQNFDKISVNPGLLANTSMNLIDYRPAQSTSRPLLTKLQGMMSWVNWTIRDSES